MRPRCCPLPLQPDGGPLSSAILYLGIVVIWACVLIPRWLRRDASRAPSVPSSPEIPWDEAGYSDEWGPDAVEDDEIFVEDDRPTLRPQHEPRQEGEDAQRRMVKARRRMLLMLVALVFGAVLLAFTSFAAWWVIVPPTLMLLGYLVLLREVAQVDSERIARREAERAEARAATERAMKIARARADARARQTAAAGSAAPGSAAPAGSPDGGTPDAEIIDISAQVGQEFFDQYADARLRAVGD
jgi:hypothetical protein